MRTFYIVIVDYQLWFGVHLGRICEQDVVISLVSSGLGRMWQNVNPASETTGGTIVQER